MTGSTPFWKLKTLAEMDEMEWESLCDGCGQCCLFKLEDADTGEYALTDVACRYLNHDSCQCNDYRNRSRNVPDCVKVAPENIATLRWMPETCAYRLLDEGKDLYWWHPLVSGNRKTVHSSGASVRDKVVNEEMVNDLEDHVVRQLNKALENGIPPLGTPPKDSEIG
ncbi:MAG TPA: YcgN family cysteine cluster protein [Rhodospirillaceae bacterium]|mgnify:CR=1 FL=1|nr:YcgN family cysteine cluster protein [Rhodospirillaceae bacterium]